jgi:hypothetical protein
MPEGVIIKTLTGYIHLSQGVWLPGMWSIRHGQRKIEARVQRVL